MMNSERGNPNERLALLLAYADGELPAKEAAELEISLTEDERAFITSEQQFKSEFAKQLGTDEVPADAWNRITRHIHDSATPTARKVRRMSFQWLLAGAAAAVFLIVVAVQMTRLSDVDILLKQSTLATVSEFKRAATVPANPEQISKLLNTHGLSLDLSGIEKMMAMPHMGVHETYLLGARTISLNGEECVSILFNCCGNPVQIVLSHVNSKAAGALSRISVVPGQFISERDLGTVHATFIGMHDARGLLQSLASPA